MPRKISKKYCFKKARLAVQGKILLLLALWLIMGCGVSDEEVASPNGDPKGGFYSLAVLNRFESGLDAELARGKELYLSNCAICHGESGDGKGFNAYNLKSNFGIQPFDFTASNGLAQLSLDEVRKAITYGGPAVNKSQYMPPWGGLLKDQQIADLIAFVQTLAERRGSTE